MNLSNPTVNHPNNCLTTICMSDQLFCTRKLSLKNLSFVVDATFLYGFYAQYQNWSGHEVKGYKIMPRIKPKTAMLKKLMMTQQELISSVEVGNDDSQFIRYVLIRTSGGHEFKWGNIANCVKREQQNICKYESITIKGKLSPIVDKEAPNYYCLSGIGFNTFSVPST